MTNKAFIKMEAFILLHAEQVKWKRTDESFLNLIGMEILFCCTLSAAKDSQKDCNAKQD